MFCPFEGTVNLIRQRGNNIQSSDWTSTCSWTMLVIIANQHLCKFTLSHILHHWQSLCWVKYYVKHLTKWLSWVVQSSKETIAAQNAYIIVIIANTFQPSPNLMQMGFMTDSTGFHAKQILPSSAQWSSSTCAFLCQYLLRTSAASIQSKHTSGSAKLGPLPQYEQLCY